MSKDYDWKSTWTQDIDGKPVEFTLQGRSEKVEYVDPRIGHVTTDVSTKDETVDKSIKAERQRILGIFRQIGTIKDDEEMAKIIKAIENKS